jgi:signal transduction histidine kinase
VNLELTISRHGKPPLRDASLLSSANFTLSLLPARLAHRIQALRNLPFIVVSNPNVSKIYNNYLHSLSTLEPFYRRPIGNIEDEMRFTEAMADLVRTHSNTIPTLAQGFLQCRRYVEPGEVTRFLDQHLRARIGTRLLAEQHLALHMASTGDALRHKPDPTHIGVIDIATNPASIVRRCESFVAEVCEYKYGIRPSLIINGDTHAEFAHIPMHLEYILTELLKNAFRATIESGNEKEPIEVTIAAAPDVATTKLEDLKNLSVSHENSYDFSQEGLNEYVESSDVDDPLSALHSAVPCITLRIRDRGGGIPPEALPNIWAYSFTTFNNEEAAAVASGGGGSEIDGLDAISSSGGPDQSSIAGLGYGLPLSRAYAEYFGGGIRVQSMYGWGTDVYLTLQGIATTEAIVNAKTGKEQLEMEAKQG